MCLRSRADIPSGPNAFDGFDAFMAFIVCSAVAVGASCLERFFICLVIFLASLLLL
jgi:hypothetical protein